MGITELPEEAIEAFFLGDAHDAWERDEALMSLVDHVLTGATGPAPRPSTALLAFLGEPSASAAVPLAATQPLVTQPSPVAPPWQARTIAVGAAPTDRGQNVVPLFRRLRLTVGIAAAAGVAAMALAVAGTTGVLPEPVMQAVSWVVEAVTPFELHEPAKTVSGRDPVPQPGPMSTVRPGPFGPIGGPGPLGQGGAPGQPAVSTTAAGQGGGPGQPAVSTPAAGQGGGLGQPAGTTPATLPTSIPVGVPGAVRPPATGVDPGPPTSAGPPAPPVPAPAVSPPAGGGTATASTTPPTSVDRTRQAPVGGTVPSTVAGASARRP
jgi:hypothetical protein